MMPIGIVRGSPAASFLSRYAGAIPMFRSFGGGMLDGLHPHEWKELGDALGTRRADELLARGAGRMEAAERRAETERRVRAAQAELNAKRMQEQFAKRQSHSVKAALDRINEARGARAHTEPDWSAAAHEAGHAYAGVKLGLPVLSVDIHKNGNIGGSTYFDNLKTRDIGAVIQAMLAGSMAEDYAVNGKLRITGMSPADTALCRRAVECMPEAQRESTLMAYIDVARILVVNHWQRIEKLARRLSVCKEMTGAEIRACVA